LNLKGKIDLSFIAREESRGEPIDLDLIGRMQRRVDIFLERRQAEADKLSRTLMLYSSCRHGSPDCFCTREARALDREIGGEA
jgi:hypothetical protein